MMLTLRRALAAGLVTLAGAAAPASADPVIAGPATPDELAILAQGPVPASAEVTTEPVALHRVSTTDGAYRGRVAFPSDSLTKTQTFGEFAILRRSGDGRFLTFTAARTPVGTEYPDSANATAVRVAADGTWTDQPLGSGYIGQYIHTIGAVTVDGSRTWVGVRDASKPLATLAPGDTALTQVASMPGNNFVSVDLVDGSLVMTTANGVHRLPGGLPTSQATTPLPVFLPATQAQDSAFVDTDGVPGADTAYVSRNTVGVTKYVLSGGTWVERGTVAGAYRQVAARAVAGAVEVYLTSQDRGSVHKLVDTAQIGAPLQSTGARLLALAPGKIGFTGLAFSPGAGFPADTSPYPPTPPAIAAQGGSIQTHVGATPKPSVQLNVFDANTSDVTVTATSSNQNVLPNSRITITGTGTTRTATFDPAAAGNATVTFTARAEGETATTFVSLNATGPVPDPTGHYYLGLVDVSAAIDVGGDHFLGVSDEVNNIRLFKKGVTGGALKSWNQGFQAREADFEGATRFGDTIVWSASHANDKSGGVEVDRRVLVFQKISGSGANVELTYSHTYGRLLDQWKAWDAANGHGLGANFLKMNTGTLPGVVPNAPNGFNVEGLTMAPGSQTTAWFGMRAPTVTGADGIERAVILPVENIDKLTSNSVDAQLGTPILLDLGGRSIRDINKNARDEYLITAGPAEIGDTSLKNWAVYTWDGNPAHDPKYVNPLPAETVVGAWEGIVEVPNPLVAGAKALLVNDVGSGSKTYGQYLTIGEPAAGPSVVTGIIATPKKGAFDVSWNAADGATRYRVTAVTAAGAHAPGSPKFVTGTSTSFADVSAENEYTVNVRAENTVTRTANGTPAKVTPVAGLRVPTTTTLAVDGVRLGGETLTLTATVSDPTAQGTIQFFVDSYGLPPIPVVNGKAVHEINYGAGVLNLRAKFIPTDREDFLASESAVVPTLLDWRPQQPWIELVSITGERVESRSIIITVKVHGYTQGQLRDLSPRFHTRMNGNEGRTNLIAGEASRFDENGVATWTTIWLKRGAQRISAGVGGSGAITSANTDEVPITIALGNTPPEEVKPLKPATAVIATVSGPGVQNPAQPLTMSARLADPTKAGTVQFMDTATGVNVGPVIPVVNGVATTTATVFGETLHLAARFEPAVDSDTTPSSVSPVVPLFRVAGAPYPSALATTTTLAVTGDRVAGKPLTAKATVAPVGGDAFAANDVYGAVELLDGDRVLGFAPTRNGVATFDVSDLGAGAHSLRARYETSNALRSTSSESAAQDVTVVVKTDVEGGVGSDVPATLALTLGAPAKFEPFVPGVAKEYTAGTSATVISTAGDAALTVSEPGHLTNGAFSLASPLRVEFSKSAWTGPVSNDSVDIAFKQAIGANDPLRTGTYSKTLTFTLATTQP